MTNSWKERKSHSRKRTILGTVPAAIIISILGFLDVIPMGNTFAFIILVVAIVGIIVYFNVYSNNSSQG